MRALLDRGVRTKKGTPAGVFPVPKNYEQGKNDASPKGQRTEHSGVPMIGENKSGQECVGIEKDENRTRLIRALEHC